MSKKVAIAGFGSEGLSAYHYFKAQGADITIFDEKKQPNQPVPADAKFVWGNDCFADLRGYDVVMRFPALRPSRITTDGEMSSVIKEFFKACPAPIIGVTGSKGKGTTSSLTHLMLNNAGKTAHIAGNIGVPALDILPDVKKDDIVVLELSSFQLWDLQQSPHVAVVLMIEPDHLDVHKDLIEYVGAKSNIVRWQTTDDTTIYLPGNQLTERIALQGEGKKIPYTQAPGAHAKDGFIVIDEHKICAVEDIALPGAHNVDNACAAVTAAWQFTQDTKAIAKALREFKGLDHRLKLVREMNGVQFYDDSIATTPGSAIAALHAFAEPKVLILGGSDKGADFTELAQTIAESSMRAVVLIGSMRDKLNDAIKAANYKGAVELFNEHSSMEQIVARAAKQAKPGDIVILSPACASFDMFKDYKDRGEQFIAAVKAL